MSFRDRLEDDILDVFLDAYEFADTHIVSGKEIIACIDSDNTVRLKNSDIIGMSEADCNLFAKTSDLPEGIKQSSVLNIDGREYQVVQIRRELGMTELALKQYRGY